MSRVHGSFQQGQKERATSQKKEKRIRPKLLISRPLIQAIHSLAESLHHANVENNGKPPASRILASQREQQRLNMGAHPPIVDLQATYYNSAPNLQVLEYCDVCCSLLSALGLA